MYEQKGWIKIHRKVLENDIYRHDPTAWKIFFYLLLNCDHKTGTVKKAHSTLISDLDIPKATLSKALNRLESAKMVNRERNPNYTLYTICKWNEYQVQTEQETELTRNQDGTKAEHIQEVRIKNKENNRPKKAKKPLGRFGDFVYYSEEELRQYQANL